MTALSPVSRFDGCPKCGTLNKSGKLSCCARGGAWFKNCGDVGDIKFDHTWVEGIQACKSFGSSIAVTSPLHVEVRHVEIVGSTVNAAPSQIDATGRQTKTNRLDSVANTDTMDSKFVGVPTAVAYLLVLCFIADCQLQHPRL